MGVAHLIGDGAAELSRIGPRYPLLPEDRIALFGFHPYEIEPKEQKRLEASAMLRYPVTAMDDRAVELATEARTRLAQRAAAFAVHFDVAVMDSAAMQLAVLTNYR